MNIHYIIPTLASLGLSIVIIFKIAPMFTKVPEKVVVDLFQTAILSCEATGQPSPLISWFKDKVIIDMEHDNTLTIDEVQLNDRGNYTCVAENSEGKIESPPALVNVASKSAATVHTNSIIIETPCTSTTCF